MAAILATNTTPAEMLIPGDAKGRVKRRLVLRNPLFQEELLVKLVLKPLLNKDNKAVTPRHSWVRVGPRSVVQLETIIDSVHLAVGQELRGYVRILPESPELAHRWLTTHIETKQQLAFSLLVRASPAFSAYDTIIDLPGSAVLVEPKNVGRAGVDDLGCEDALLLDAGTNTARAFGSLENVAVELRKAGKSSSFAKAAKEDACWLLKRVFNCDETQVQKKQQPPRMTELPKKRSAVLESQYIEPSMNRAV